jgi:two-component system LytT family response regulator
MRVLIVDDEPLARNALANALSGRKDIEQFDSAHDALEALEKLGSNVYDVMLLDVDMPELSGIELLERLEKRGRPLPSVVFVTAHHEHAIAAFEKHATDYVLKPFSSERIFEALDEASRRTAGERAAKLIEALPQLQLSSRRAPTRIAIKAKGRILFIEPKDVTVVEAEGNYVLLQRRSGSYLLRESISTVAEKLKPYGFIRIHRSVLVNSAYVEEIQPWFTGEYTLRVTGGKEYMVSRTYKKNLKALADYWLGTDTFVGD